MGTLQTFPFLWFGNMPSALNKQTNSLCTCPLYRFTIQPCYYTLKWLQHVHEHPIWQLRYLSLCKHSSVTSSLERCLSEAASTQVQGDQVIIPLPSGRNRTDIGIALEIASLGVTWETKQAALHGTTMMRCKEAGYSSCCKNMCFLWDIMIRLTIIIRLSTLPFTLIKIELFDSTIKPTTKILGLFRSSAP